MDNKDTVLFSGFAKVPQNAPYYNQSQELGCVMEIDMVSKTIINCQFGRLKPLTTEFLNRMIIGYDLSQGIEMLIKEINRRCQLVSKYAVIKSIEICYQKFLDYHG